MKGLAVPEMKTKNSEDVCPQDPTLSSGTALQKEAALSAFAGTLS